MADCHVSAVPAGRDGVCAAPNFVSLGGEGAGALRADPTFRLGASAIHQNSPVDLAAIIFPFSFKEHGDLQRTKALFLVSLYKTL
jgi:hypothetical protein